MPTAAARYFNPRSPHGERRSREVHFGNCNHFNPRSPHGERLGLRCRMQSWRRFQSTLPARGATNPLLMLFPDSPAFQSTLPARGATWSMSYTTATPSNFNPRSPHGERPAVAEGKDKPKEFQSTLPARGATFRLLIPDGDAEISIHAPRTGSDATGMHPFLSMRISIHAPRTGSDN